MMFLIYLFCKFSSLSAPSYVHLLAEHHVLQKVTIRLAHQGKCLLYSKCSVITVGTRRWNQVRVVMEARTPGTIGQKHKEEQKSGHATSPLNSSLAASPGQ